MKADEIFQISVNVMKQLLTPEGMLKAIKRAKGRSQEENTALLDSTRENINELVRKIAASGGAGDALEGASQELTDAMVMRYLRNREIFMKTFPDGIEEIDPDPVSIWASVMISPLDEKPDSVS